MSQAAQLGLTLVYLLPVALLALLLGSPARRPRWQIVLILCALPFFYLGHYLLLERLPGWPSGSPLPDSFQLLAFQIDEPDRQQDSPGRILLWVQSAQHRQPRAHAMPYSKALHQRLVAAETRLTQGHRQQGRRTSPSSDTAGASVTQESEISFRDLPQQRLPAKQSDG